MLGQVWLWHRTAGYWIVHAFVVCWLFFALKISFRITIRKSNGLDPDQARHSVCPDLGPNCLHAGPLIAFGNVSGYRCVSDCRSRGREFDPGPVPYFRGDWSWNYFYSHSPPFRWFIQEGLLSVTSESMCTNYWLTACSSLPRKKCG